MIVVIKWFDLDKGRRQFYKIQVNIFGIMLKNCLSNDALNLGVILIAHQGGRDEGLHVEGGFAEYWF